MADEECVESSENVSNESRKRKRQPEKWKKNVNKSAKYKKEGKQPKISCEHTGLRSAKGQKIVCQASKLTTKDVQQFFNQLYESGKADQDAFLLLHLSPSVPKRQRTRADCGRKRPIQTKYFIRKADSGSPIRVCSAAFLSIACVSRFRLNRLAKHAISHGGTPKEKRGGKKINEIVATGVLPTINEVKAAKKKGVEKLMSYFTISKKAKDFYNDVLSANSNNSDDLEADINDDDEKFL